MYNLRQTEQTQYKCQLNKYQLNVSINFLCYYKNCYSYKKKQVWGKNNISVESEKHFHVTSRNNLQNKTDCSCALPARAIA